MTALITGFSNAMWLLILMSGLFAIAKVVIAGILHFQRAEREERESLMLMLTEAQRQQAASKRLRLPEPPATFRY